RPAKYSACSSKCKSLRGGRFRQLDELAVRDGKKTEVVEHPVAVGVDLHGIVDQVEAFRPHDIVLEDGRVAAAGAGHGLRQKLGALPPRVGEQVGGGFEAIAETAGEVVAIRPLVAYAPQPKNDAVLDRSAAVLLEFLGQGRRQQVYALPVPVPP